MHTHPCPRRILLLCVRSHPSLCLHVPVAVDPEPGVSPRGLVADITTVPVTRITLTEAGTATAAIIPPPAVTLVLALAISGALAPSA